MHRATWIVDEAHAENPETQALVALLEIEASRGMCSVIPLTATWKGQLMRETRFAVADVHMDDWDNVDKIHEIADNVGVTVVFVPSVVAAKKMQSAMKKKDPDMATVILCRETFEDAYHQARDLMKGIIYTTNIAEMGCNLKGADVVIDSQLCYRGTLTENSTSVVLGTQTISHASQVQRRGRIGRSKEGTYYSPNRILTMEEDPLVSWERDILMSAMNNATPPTPTGKRINHLEEFMRLHYEITYSIFMAYELSEQVRETVTLESLLSDSNHDPTFIFTVDGLEKEVHGSMLDDRCLSLAQSLDDSGRDLKGKRHANSTYKVRWERRSVWASFWDRGIMAAIKDLWQQGFVSLGGVPVDMGYVIAVTLTVVSTLGLITIVIIYLMKTFGVATTGFWDFFNAIVKGGGIGSGTIPMLMVYILSDTVALQWGDWKYDWTPSGQAMALWSVSMIFDYLRQASWHQLAVLGAIYVSAMANSHVRTYFVPYPQPSGTYAAVAPVASSWAITTRSTAIPYMVFAGVAALNGLFKTKGVLDAIEIGTEPLSKSPAGLKKIVTYTCRGIDLSSAACLFPALFLVTPAEVILAAIIVFGILLIERNDAAVEFFLNTFEGATPTDIAPRSDKARLWLTRVACAIVGVAWWGITGNYSALGAAVPLALAFTAWRIPRLRSMCREWSTMCIYAITTTNITFMCLVGAIYMADTTGNNSLKRGMFDVSCGLMKRTEVEEQTQQIDRGAVQPLQEQRSENTWYWGQCCFQGIVQNRRIH